MQRVDELDYALRDRWRALAESRRRTLAALSAKLAQLDVRLQFARARRRLDGYEAAMEQHVKLALNRAHRDLGPLQAHLAQLSPLKVLDRGYAIVEREGRVVKSPADAPAPAEIGIRLAGGRIKARVL